MFDVVGQMSTGQMSLWQLSIIKVDDVDDIEFVIGSVKSFSFQTQLLLC